MGIFKRMKVAAALKDKNSARAQWENVRINNEIRELRNKNVALKQENHVLKHRCQALTHQLVCNLCTIENCEYRSTHESLDS